METNIKSMSEEKSDEITVVTDDITGNIVLFTDEELGKSSSEEDDEYFKKYNPVATSFIITCVAVAIVVGILIASLISSILIDNYNKGVTEVDEYGTVSETSDR
jgi:hypothetical protein